VRANSVRRVWQVAWLPSDASLFWSCIGIANVKPWLLCTHPQYDRAGKQGAYVLAAPDAVTPADTDRRGAYGEARSWHWSSGFGVFDKGAWIDFSGSGGSDWWRERIRSVLLAKGITGVW
jgi:hypothetical protein